MQVVPNKNATRRTTNLHQFATNCRKLYIPQDHMTVDKMLIPFCGRVEFLVYMKSQPTKYGMKLWLLANLHSQYTWNIQAYTGKIGKKVEANQGQQVVLDL